MQGEVIRILPHGTVIVWNGYRAFPYYGEGKEKFRLEDKVLFSLNHDESRVTWMERLDTENPGR